MCLKTAGQVSSEIDPDKKLHSVASVLDLHCLLRPGSPNTEQIVSICTKRQFFLDTAHCILSAVGLFGHSLDIMWQTACLVINPIIVNGYASLLIARRRFGSQHIFKPQPTPVGWGLKICLWLGPPWFNYWFLFTLAHSRISHEYSSLFIIVINLIFMFLLWCFDQVGSLYANQFLFISVLTIASGPRVKLPSCKSA